MDKFRLLEKKIWHVDEKSKFLFDNSEDDSYVRFF